MSDETGEKMDITITEICQAIRNYFVAARHSGTFEIKGGTITAPFLKPGQYFCICNSFFNDGVHLYPVRDLRNESFTGDILVMELPQDFIQLAAEIKEWRERYEAPDGPAMSSFAAESFGNYEYKRGDCAASWTTVFGPRLSVYRKVRW